MSHYDAPDLLSRVAALLPSGPLALLDLAAFDQFHVGGLKSTEHLAEQAGLSAGMTVLDVGSGVGGPSRYLASQGCRVTGLDLSADYVALSRQLAKRVGLAVDYVCADALAMPFEDGAFDLVWTQHASMNIADKLGLHSGVRRVLKPGGKLAFHDVCAGQEEMRLPVPWASKPEHSALISPDELRILLQGLGFEFLYWRDATEEALAFLSRLPETLPPLSLRLLLGDGAREMMATYAGNLREKRVSVVEAVACRNAA